MRSDSSAHWLSFAAKTTITEVIRKVEERTNAEVVVTVRAAASTYRHIDMAVGAAVAFAALLVYVYFPVTFVDDLAPPAILVCFFAGALMSNGLDSLKRRFLSQKARRQCVRLAARAAFVDQRVSSTRERIGVLIYVSLLERDVEVLPDVGIDTGALGTKWQLAVEKIESVVRANGSVSDFGVALVELGEALTLAVPKTENDINELPDEVASDAVA